MKILLILLRLLLMAGFFLGLFLLIRLESPWHAIAGSLLMLLSVPMNDLLVAVGQGKPAGMAELLSGFHRTIPIILPAILFVLAILGIFHVAEQGKPGYLFLYLFAGIPLFIVLARAVHGDLAWKPALLAMAFSRLVTFQLSYLGLVLGTLFMGLVVGVMGTIALLITLGNLAWQWLAEPGEPVMPFFCSQCDLGTGIECGMSLAGLHLLQLLMLYIMLRYGDRMFDSAARWVNSYRD